MHDENDAREAEDAWLDDSLADLAALNHTVIPAGGSSIHDTQIHAQGTITELMPVPATYTGSKSQKANCNDAFDNRHGE
jgi:hypothetical protein